MTATVTNRDNNNFGGNSFFLQPYSFFYSNFVKGWALDTSATLDRGQVAFVELLLDGNAIADTRRDCVHLGSAFLNCYGVNRPDVAAAYQGYVNADNAGSVIP